MVWYVGGGGGGIPAMDSAFEWILICHMVDCVFVLCCRIDMSPWLAREMALRRCY